MPNHTHSYVVLDADILASDFWMAGTDFSHLLTHGFLGHRPVIPDLAYREARNQLRLRAETLLGNREADGSGSSGNTARLLRVFNLRRASGQSWDVDRLLERWDQHVRRTLKRCDGLILPPSLAMPEIAEPSLDRRPPFPSGDRGFTDTLRWLTTLELGPESCVSFVTGHTDDFFDARSGGPHAEIIAEAEGRLEGVELLFHRSLDEFIHHFDSDRAPSADALRRALIANTFSGCDLWDWLEANLVTICEDDFDSVRWAGVPEAAEAPLLRDVEELVALGIGRVRLVRGDLYRVYCDVSFIGVFECEIGYTIAESVVHPQQIVWKDDSDSFWTTIGLRAAATLMVAVDLDVERRKVMSALAVPLTHWEDYGRAVSRVDEVRAILDAPASEPGHLGDDDHLEA